MAQLTDKETAARILEPLTDHWAIGPWIRPEGDGFTDCPDRLPHYTSLSTGERAIVDLIFSVQTGRFDFDFADILGLDMRWRARIITALAGRAGVVGLGAGV